MTQQAGASWAAAAPPAPAWPNSPPAPAWTTVSPPPPGTAAGWSAALPQTTAQGPGWGVASPPQLEQQGARLLKRQRPDSSDQDERQLQQGWQQQQQQWQDESEQPPAQRRRRLEPTLQQHTHAQSLPPGAGQHQHWLPLFPADQQQQSQAAQQPGAPPDIDLLPADSGDVADGSDSGEAEEPLRKRLQLGGSEVRLMLPTPLPRSIPLDLPPSASWHQAPPCHPDSLAWAVVPWSPTAPLSELAGMPAAGTSGAGASMGSPGQVRRLGLRFDHERPLPGVDTSASLSAAAAPGIFIEELPHPAAEGGLDAAAGGSCEAMEE